MNRLGFAVAASALLVLSIAGPVAAADDPTPLPAECSVSSDGVIVCPNPVDPPPAPSAEPEDPATGGGSSGSGGSDDGSSSSGSGSIATPEPVPGVVEPCDPAVATCPELMPVPVPVDCPPDAADCSVVPTCEAVAPEGAPDGASPEPCVYLMDRTVVGAPVYATDIVTTGVAVDANSPVHRREGIGVEAARLVLVGIGLALAVLLAVAGLRRRRTA